MSNINTIVRPRIHVDLGVLATNAFAKFYVGTVASASARALVPSAATVVTAVTATEAGMRGTDLRDAGTEQGSPPRGNPR